MVPVYDSKDMVYIERENFDLFYRTIVYDFDFNLCWNYFVQNYHCYVIHSEDVDFNEKLFYGFYNIQFSFKELEHLNDKSRVLTVTKGSQCDVFDGVGDYVSDHAGLALFSRNNSVLELYYRDIVNKFTSNIKIPFSCVHDSKVKLVNGTVWIVTWKPGGTSVDAICVKNEKEWYHITSTSRSPIELGNIESSNMLVTISNHCSAWKVFDINNKILKVNQTNEIDFVELQIPMKLDDEQYLYVVFIFKTTVILNYRSPSYSTKVFYFLTYEGSHLKSYKRMNLKEVFQNSKHGFSELKELLPYNINIIPELGKMILMFNTNILFIIDPGTCEVVQALNPLNTNPEKWSNTLKQIVGNLPTICLSVFDHFMNLALKGLTPLLMMNRK